MFNRFTQKKEMAYLLKMILLSSMLFSYRLRLLSKSIEKQQSLNSKGFSFFKL